MQIDIEVPRPMLTLAMIGAAVWYFGGFSGDLLPADAIGGTGTTQAQVIQDAEEDVKRVRLEQQVLNRREDILRAELDALTAEQKHVDSPALEDEIYNTRKNLIALIQDQHAAEQEILESLRQIWEAQGYAQQASRSETVAGSIDLIWPVAPELGLSAFFEDDAYEARFGIPHHAVDIPIAQGSTVHAAADGVIAKVSDNGMGFSSLVIRHDGGFATMYGHISGFLVEEGQKVRAGDAVALSGGRPGTKGAGRLTTGAHLHFEVLKDGTQVNPLQYLPEANY